MDKQAYGRLTIMFDPWQRRQKLDAVKLQVHNIVSSNKMMSKVSFPRGLEKTSTKIIVNLQ